MAHPDFSVADLQRSWIAPPTEVTRKAGLTIFVSTAFYVALLAPDTSDSGVGNQNTDAVWENTNAV